MVILRIRCKTHPAYKAIRPPKADIPCPTCLRLWQLANMSDGKLLITRVAD